MQLYTVITENDDSKWNDDTGSRYHFPSRYLKYLEPGTNLIYYKGRIKDKAFRSIRLSDDPHYFGVARVASVYEDSNSQKNDYYANLTGFNLFPKAVLAKQNGIMLETIPQSRQSNYWRDGVRLIDEGIYNNIIRLLGRPIDIKDSGLQEEQGAIYAPKRIEGGKSIVYSVKYERNAALKGDVVRIHGHSCMACGFNFFQQYGEWGADFIHAHHIKPISSYEEKHEVDPRTDFVVLCPNCHAMVHRKREKVLSLDELKALLSHKI